VLNYIQTKKRLSGGVTQGLPQILNNRSLRPLFLLVYLLSLSAIIFAIVFLYLFIYPPNVSADGLTLTVSVIGDKQCNDGQDNDSDGKVDYPADDGCDSSTDDDETDASSGNDNNGGGGGGGSSGGGGGGIVRSNNSVVFRGFAQPNSTVTILKDAQIARSTEANQEAYFEVELSDLSSGTYVFSVKSENKNELDSLTRNVTVSVSGGRTILVSGIFLPPIIKIDKAEVKLGDILNISGQSVPGSVVSVFVDNEESPKEKVDTDTDGFWSYELDTSILEYGDHTISSKAEKDNDITTFSNFIGFIVGTQNLDFIKVSSSERADMSGDNRVNLADFSIAAYWYERPSPPPEVDFNSDGKVDLVDFSIMAFYWTG
jgi:hypothetical protein